MTSRREIASIGNCLLCDSLFVLVIASIPAAREFSGRKGAKELEDLLEAIQHEHFGRVVTPTTTTTTTTTATPAETETSLSVTFHTFPRASLPSSSSSSSSAPSASSSSSSSSASAEELDGFEAFSLEKGSSAKKNSKTERGVDSKEWVFEDSVHLLPCPTCAELVSGKSWIDYVGEQKEIVFSPCVFVSWEEGEFPALYLNEHQADHNKKPKWTLSQGVGPKTLELDSSKSGRLYKPALRDLLGESRSVPFSTLIAPEGTEKSSNSQKPTRTTSKKLPNVNTVLPTDFKQAHAQMLQFWEYLFGAPWGDEEFQTPTRKRQESVLGGVPVTGYWDENEAEFGENELKVELPTHAPEKSVRSSLGKAVGQFKALRPAFSRWDEVEALTRTWRELNHDD